MYFLQVEVAVAMVVRSPFRCHSVRRKSSRAIILSEVAVASREQVEVIKRGTDAWNSWRKAHPKRKVALAEANLSMVSLGGANLAYAKLTQADLTRADLACADLTGARQWCES